MNKRYYEHTLPIIRGSLSNTYVGADDTKKIAEGFERVAVLGSIRVIVSLGKPVGIGSLTGFVLQFRNAE